MQSIDVLYWALSIVFCLALVFAILLWCRGWRREEQEASTRQIQLLAREVKRLAEAIETLTHTASSLQTADEQLTRHLESLREAVRDLKRRQSVPVQHPMPEPPSERVSQRTITPVGASAITQPAPEKAETADDEDRYDQARALLRAGRDPVDVARQLDLGTAEVNMIARLLQTPDTNA